MGDFTPVDCDLAKGISIREPPIKFGICPSIAPLSLQQCLQFPTMVLYFTTTLFRSNIWDASKTQERNMIRINPKRRFHVSNRLALVGALTLALTFFTGMDGMQDDAYSAMNESSIASTEMTSETNDSDTADRRKRFSISRLLFGHG